MASNNAIIAEAAKMAGLENEELHTFAVWKAEGFSIRRGEKAILKTDLWQKQAGKFTLVPCSLFSASQVKLIDDSATKQLVKVYDNAGSVLHIAITKGKGYTIAFPNYEEKCKCDSMEAVCRELIDFCKFADYRFVAN